MSDIFCDKDCAPRCEGCNKYLAVCMCKGSSNMDDVFKTNNLASTLRENAIKVNDARAKLAGRAFVSSILEEAKMNSNNGLFSASKDVKYPSPDLINFIINELENHGFKVIVTDTKESITISW